nr:hypothetical protein [Tanacetum cinerariifolium]
SSSLSVSSGFGNQFLKLSSDSSLVSTIKVTIDAEINLLLEVKIQSEVPHIHEGIGTKPGVSDEEKDITEENVILEWGSEQESEYYKEEKLDDDEKDDKEGDADVEDDDTESDKDDIYKYKIRVRKDEDEEMLNAEVDDINKGNEEVTDAAKANA